MKEKKFDKWFRKNISRINSFFTFWCLFFMMFDVFTSQWVWAVIQGLFLILFVNLHTDVKLAEAKNDYEKYLK